MMFKLRFFQTFLVTVALTFGLFALVPKIALADPFVALDTTSKIVNVASVYETNPKTQAKVLLEVLESEQARLPKASGFLDASVLKGQDGTKVVTLSQWLDLPSFQAYQKELAEEISSSTKPRTFVFEVKKVETKSTTPTINENESIMYSEFKMKDLDKQSELADIVGQMMPGVMQMESGLQWAAMGPSTDKSTIALIAEWDSRQDFESLGKNPGFDKDTAYWQNYADNEHDIFDVVKTIR